MSIRDLLLGRPLRSDEEATQKIGVLRAIPVLGLDALASAAYGPEAALTILLPLGAHATHLIGPITAVIIALLVVVAASYHQTISAYPGRAGAYTVASENLGRGSALLAASALLLDYILNVAVAISAGVGALVSAVPALLPHTLGLCLAILALLAIVNLRGVREAGLLFMAPTYLFVATLGLIVILGSARALAAHGRPAPVAPLPPLPPATTAVTPWLLLRAFASGCTAMTGVEAVSIAVPLFAEPQAARAERTLTAIVGILALFLAGIAFLAFAYGIVATPPGRAGYESVLSQLVGAVAGRGAFYYITMVAILSVLTLSANTSFATLPRLCRLLALDEFLPAGFAHPGRRLVYSAGIVALALAAGALLVIFGGITDRLIPLFAIGAFTAFTLSQAGMVVHWRRVGGGHAGRAGLINAIGAAATGTTAVVVAISKFTQGAWLSVLAIPAVMALLHAIRRDAERIEREVAERGPLALDHRPPPIVVVPLKRLDRVARKALQLALTLSPEVEVVQVLREEPGLEDLRPVWRVLVEEPAIRAGFTPPRLVVIRAIYRELYGPLLRHVRQLLQEHPGRAIGVVIPELMDRRWYQVLLRSHRSELLKGLLLLHGGPRVIVINTPWYRRAEAATPPRGAAPPRS